MRSKKPTKARTATATADELKQLIKRLKSHMTDASVSEGDGLRLSWPDRWLLVLNFEPVAPDDSEEWDDAETLAAEPAPPPPAPEPTPSALSIVTHDDAGRTD